MTRSIVCIVVCAVLMSATHAVAAITTQPTDLNPGDQYRLAFVTSATRDATSSNIQDYNDFVSGIANSVTELAALGTTWKAIGSTATVDARDNTGTNPSSTVPIYRLDDTRIWGGDMWVESPLPSLSINENGAELISLVWTGTATTGMKHLTIHLGGPHSLSMVGYSGATGTAWTAWQNPQQTDLHPMYALSGILTVVPEPGALSLAWFGAAGVVAWQFRRRRLE